MDSLTELVCDSNAASYHCDDLTQRECAPSELPLTRSQVAPEPSYAKPSCTKPSYAKPSYAKPSCAKPSYATPSYGKGYAKRFSSRCLPRIGE